MAGILSDTSVAQVRQDLERRFNDMASEYNNWKSSHQDLSTYIDSTLGVFNGDRSRIGKMIDHKKVLDSHATYAKNTLASGLQTGMADPTRPWFKLIFADAEINKRYDAKIWIEEVENRMYRVLNTSNIYGVLYSAYEELGQFGTAAFCVLDDFEEVVRAFSFTSGEYYLSVDNKGRVNGIAREFEMTVLQIVEEFGLESASATVKAHYIGKRYDAYIKIRHIILPNKYREVDKIDSRNMPWASVYWESGSSQDSVLARRGYRKFCVVAPRWKTQTTNTPYGHGPGWYALGDVKELQATKKDKLLLQEKIQNPPMQQDASVNGHANILPGGVTKSSSQVPNAGVRPAYQVPDAINAFLESINELRDSINKHFFVNIFLLFATIDRKDVTATEIAAKQQEKMMMLGPILHRLNNELHGPLIELVFEIMFENGLIPPPPTDIAGAEVKIEYISILAQAQKAVGIESIRRTVGFAFETAQVAPQILDNIDFDETIRMIAEMENAPTNMLVDKNQIEAIRQQRERMQNLAASAELADKGADAVKKLGNTDMDKNSALKGLTKNLPTSQ